MGGPGYAWEGVYALTNATTYSTNTSFNYIHYTLNMSSTLRDEFADHITDGNPNVSRISLGLS